MGDRAGILPAMTAPALPATEPAHLLTVAEVARRLNVSQVTVRRWERKGHGPTPVRMSPRLVRYRAEDIEAWIASA